MNSTGYPVPCQPTFLSGLSTGHLVDFCPDMSQNGTYVGNRIRARRTGKRLSQAALSKMSGISQQALSDIELGKTQNPREVQKIAKALDCSVEALYGDEPEPDRLTPDQLFNRIIRELSNCFEIYGQEKPDGSTFLSIATKAHTNLVNGHYQSVDRAVLRAFVDFQSGVRGN